MSDNSAFDRLVRLAGVTRVDSHKRVTKTGKVVDVKSYTRAVSEMSNADLYSQFKDLSAGNGPSEWEGPTKVTQVRNRLQQVSNEIRERQSSGNWGHSNASAASRAQNKVAFEKGAGERGRVKSRTEFAGNKENPKAKIERLQTYDTGERDDAGKPKRDAVRDRDGRTVETPEYKRTVSRVVDTLDKIFGNPDKGIAPDAKKIREYDTQQKHGLFEEVTDKDGTKKQKFVAYTPERTEQHKKILNDILEAHKDVPAERKAIMSGGLGGAGKGYVLEKYAGVSHNDFLTIDPDEMKQEILKRGMGPDIEGLLPMEQAAFIHEESSDLANMLHEIAMARGMNVILDTTMAAKKGDGYKSSADGKIEKFENAGYEIRGVFVDVPVEVSVASALDRHLGGVNKFNSGTEGGELGGRYVPPSYIEASTPPPESKFNSRNREVFERLRREGRFTESEVWDNSDRTSSPKLESRTPKASVDPSKTSKSAIEALKSKQEKKTEKVGLSAVERLRRVR